MSALCLVILLDSRVRRYAIKRALLDIPNHRSSHDNPTPRGGGLAILITYVGILPFIGYLYPSGWNILLLIGLSAAAIGGLGWVDDRSGLSPGLRLVIQSLVAIGLIAVIGPFRELELGGLMYDLQWLAWPVTLLWVVWLTNLYNFMDGIDGIAGTEAAVGSGTIAVWFALYGEGYLAIVSLVLMGAVLGFLVWNWPPARIFLGDVGSIMLGMLFAVLSVIGVTKYGMPWTGFIILLSVFLADATVTLIRRIIRKEILSQPHRSHFYQRAVQCGWSHRQVTTSVLLVNLVLAGLATLEVMRVRPGILWIGLAVILLVILALFITQHERRRIVT